jgi:CRISPR-associated protein Csm3
MTRLVVRDCPLSAESRKALTEGKTLTEEKHENTINRITAMANPRPIERVVPGVTFDLELMFRVLDTDDDGAMDEKFFSDVVIFGLALVQQDCLGGGGSRGNGRVEFIDLKDETGNAITLPDVMEAAG